MGTGDGYQRRNKPPKLAGQGGLMLCTLGVWVLVEPAAAGRLHSVSSSWAVLLVLSMSKAAGLLTR